MLVACTGEVVMLSFGLMVVRVWLGCICGQAVVTLWFGCGLAVLDCGWTVVRLWLDWLGCGLTVLGCG